jgi:hypothetical protein
MDGFGKRWAPPEERRLVPGAYQPKGKEHVWGVRSAGRSSVLKELSFEVAKNWSFSDAGRPAMNVVDAGLDNTWTSHHRDGCGLILKLEQPCVVTAILLYNKSVSRVSISLADKDLKRSYVEVCSNKRLKHNCWEELRPGSLPCQYIRINCLRGTPVCIGSIKVMGIPLRGMHAALGPGYANLLIRKPLESLYGSSLEESLPDKRRSPKSRPKLR